MPRLKFLNPCKNKQLKNEKISSNWKIVVNKNQITRLQTFAIFIAILEAKAVFFGQKKSHFSIILQSIFSHE